MPWYARGRGLVAIVIPFFLVLGLQAVVIGVGSRETWVAHVSGFLALALAASGAILLVLATRWATAERVVLDEASDQRVSGPRRDALFWVPIRYWALFYFGAAAVAVAYGVLRGTL